MHGPGPLTSPGQLGAKLHAPAAHVASQAHARLQSTSSHAPCALQPIVHGPPEHARKWQLPEESQSILHAPTHASVVHRSVPLRHLIWQGPPLQPNLLSSHDPGAEQSTVHAVGEHVSANGV